MLNRATYLDVVKGVQMSRVILEPFRDRVVLAASILSGAIIVAALIVAFGMRSLGEKIELAGFSARPSSTLDVRVRGPVQIESK
jgi:hypothetical protein